MSSSPKLTTLLSGQQLVIKNINSNLAGFYQVSYLSGRSTIDVFYELRIGNGLQFCRITISDYHTHKTCYNFKFLLPSFCTV